MKDVKRAQDLIGSEVYDREGDRIGRVGNVYVDDANHQPQWVTVRTGLFGTKESFVPLSGAERGDKGINVEVTKEKVRDAPRVDAEQGHLSDKEGHDLYDYYGLQQGSTSPQQQQRDVPQQQTGAGEAESGKHTGTAGAAAGGMAAGGAAMAGGRTSTGATEQDAGSTSGSATGTTSSGMTGSGTRTGSGTTAASGSATAGGDAAGMKSMTRSEERLRVNTEQIESGRVRVRKYVVTEQQTVTVPISHEEVRIEREPIGESERGSMPATSSLGEDEQEVVLHEDRPMVTKESVPVERLRLRTELVTEERTVQDEVQRERFDVQDQTGGGKHQRSGDQGSSTRGSGSGGSGSGSGGPGSGGSGSGATGRSTST
ncbi:PRC and DUF2382 domain-containing protein [Saccharopolyspora sp. NFXS83]|uniref:PRC and DUF2382 domain-containing protein n=1 Tax=Saccharopolyspora sp. NFXS83 TaxID=2993560 RepID=UPI00224B2D1D|nr:PRC and DUF2382 domain-containing protein [Saccharopolyspora sp. NFXS83]MCX2729052.1 PRC and DUF2382 domain-containing protein [Saccharopolyspora sp. NFXS83]